MPALAEPLNLGDLLKYEAPNLYSRDRVTVASGQNLPLGTVVGIVTATGKPTDDINAALLKLEQQPLTR